MRILYLNHNVARKGGTFYRAYHTARYLVRRGHEVTLLTISADRRTGFEYECSEGVTIIHTPDLLTGVGRTGWDLWDTACRVGLLHGRTWDIIHAWDCRPAVILPALYARAQSRSVGGKLVIDWCDWWGRGGTQAERPGRLTKLLYGPVETFFEEAFRSQADATTVASRALHKRALGLGVRPDPLLIMPGGSDTETIKPLDRGAARTELGVPQDAYIVGYMGALPLKEVDLLVETLAIARRQIPQLRFMAIGVSVAGSTLPLRDVMGSRLGDWMIETGRVPFAKVSEYLAACDVLALPMRNNISNVARWPSKLNDYLASGRPIVATSVGEIEAFAGHGFGIFTRDTAQDLAAGIVQFANDANLSEHCGALARRLAEGQLNWHTIVSDLEALYTQVYDRA